MNKIICLVAMASVAFGVSPSLAQVHTVVGGSMPSTSYTVCNVDPVWAVNPRAHQLSRGGYAFSGVGAPGTVVTRSWNNGVFVAKKHVVTPSYTYLDPVDGSGLPPCS